MSPPTNFLIKAPTIIAHDEHEFLFSGFSLFSHYKLAKLPMCKVIRFNIEYTILYVEEPAPRNFTIQELSLFGKHFIIWYTGIDTIFSTEQKILQQCLFKAVILYYKWLILVLVYLNNFRGIPIYGVTRVDWFGPGKSHGYNMFTIPFYASICKIFTWRRMWGTVQFKTNIKYNRYIFT